MILGPDPLTRPSPLAMTLAQRTVLKTMTSTSVSTKSNTLWSVTSFQLNRCRARSSSVGDGIISAPKSSNSRRSGPSRSKDHASKSWSFARTSAAWSKYLGAPSPSKLCEASKTRFVDERIDERAASASAPTPLLVL